MKLLWAKTNLLHPLDSGGTIRSYQMLKHLKNCHDITYVALQLPGSEAEASQAQEYCHRLVTVPWRGAPRRSELRFYRQAIQNLFSELPLPLERYRVPALDEALTDLTTSESFDVAVCDFLFPAPSFHGIHETPKLLFQHNVETLIWERMAKTGSVLSRHYFASQAKRMRRWEQKLARHFDTVVTVSPEDAQLIRDLFDIERVAHVPTGVDTSFYHPRPNSASSRDVAFVGSLDWLPNIDAVHWLLEEIWPEVLRRHPDANLSIVGRRPGRAFTELISRSKNVSLYADVPDIRQYLWRAAVVVIPLRVGGGTRLKIFEALACEKAVVSTPVGAEGLPVTDGEHLLLRSDAAGFARTVSSLIQDPIRAKQLGAAGRGLVAGTYSWAQVSRTFSEICSGLRDAAQGGGQC